MQQVYLPGTIVPEAPDQHLLSVGLGQIGHDLELLTVKVPFAYYYRGVIRAQLLPYVIPGPPVAVDALPRIDAQAVKDPVESVLAPADDMLPVGSLVPESTTGPPWA